MLRPAAIKITGHAGIVAAIVHAEYVYATAHARTRMISPPTMLRAVRCALFHGITGLP